MKNVEKKKLFRNLDDAFGEKSSDIVLEIIGIEMEEVYKQIDERFKSNEKRISLIFWAIALLGLLMTIYKFIG